MPAEVVAAGVAEDAESAGDASGPDDESAGAEPSGELDDPASAGSAAAVVGAVEAPELGDPAERDEMAAESGVTVEGSPAAGASVATGAAIIAAAAGGVPLPSDGNEPPLAAGE
jgi:hypothetical protein